LHPEFRQTVLTPRLQKIKNIFPVSMVISLIAVIMVFVLRRHGTIQGPYYVLMLIFVVSFMITSGRPRLLFLTGIVVFIGCMVTRFPTRPVETGRNFFGSYAVYDFKDQGILNRYFFHGNTLHGLEPLDKKDLVDRYHSTYYARGNPIADVLKITNTKTWAVIGLGSGQLACYDPKLTTDFYEIDQDVEKIARKYFTYLTECPPRDILIGDGRLKLKSENRHYDVIILDAFSSDGIPIHLLTKEALALYKSRLNENGVLLFHISNRYLELAPPIAAAAKENNLTALLRMGTKDSRYPLMQISKWVAVPLKTESSKLLLEKGWENVTPSAKTWTDDRSSLLDAISFHPRVK
jgi:hypothetical protein